MVVIQCMYVPKEDNGDLLWGFGWTPAVTVLDSVKDLWDISKVDANLYDKETGAWVGDNLNICTSFRCDHEDCAPSKIICEIED